MILVICNVASVSLRVRLRIYRQSIALSQTMAWIVTETSQAGTQASWMFLSDAALVNDLEQAGSTNFWKAIVRLSDL